MPSDRSARPPRRPGDGRGRRPGGPGPRGGGRPPASERGASRPPARGGRGSGPAGRGPRRPPTAAERRAAEVNARRGPRPPIDPAVAAAHEREKIEGRELDRWIDEGELRSEAVGAAARAQARPRRERPRDLDPEDAAEVGAHAADPRRAAVLRERLAHAQAALDGERFDEARRIGNALARELPGVAAVHELLGLTAYRSGRWKQAVGALETAQGLRPNVELLPVLADSYRALRRYADVERVWGEVKAQSPNAEVMAEARIVAASTQADQGDLAAALRTMSRAGTVPKRVRDHHLRQWYVLADLYDRAGDPLLAARWFGLVAQHDADFVDVTQRLRALGR